MIAATDRGFTLGDGLFETVLSEAGELVDWTAHMQRLARGCAALNLPAPDLVRVRKAAEDALAAAGLEAGRAAVRITWSAGPGGRGLERPGSPAPTLAVTCAPAPLPGTPARLITSRLRRNEASPTSRHKTLSSLDNVLARREAVGAGADEAVMLNTRGQVACAAAGNLFWLAGGVLFTPSLDCGVLAGTVRARILARHAVQEVAATPADLARAEAIFLTNSLIGVRAVANLDGRDLPYVDPSSLSTGSW